MPDISLCVNSRCPVRDKCYRYLAKPSGVNQSYCHFQHEKDRPCEDFLEIYPSSRERSCIGDVEDVDRLHRNIKGLAPESPETSPYFRKHTK